MAKLQENAGNCIKKFNHGGHGAHRVKRFYAKPTMKTSKKV
jgi:hypothetical protein